MDLECALLAVDCLQDVVELGDERPKGTRSNDEKEDAVHLGPPQQRAQSHDTCMRGNMQIFLQTHTDSAAGTETEAEATAKAY